MNRRVKRVLEQITISKNKKRLAKDPYPLTAEQQEFISAQFVIMNGYKRASDILQAQYEAERQKMFTEVRKWHPELDGVEFQVTSESRIVTAGVKIEVKAPVIVEDNDVPQAPARPKGDVQVG